MPAIFMAQTASQLFPDMDEVVGFDPYLGDIETITCHALVNTYCLDTQGARPYRGA
jgi:hypothetical protein